MAKVYCYTSVIGSSCITTEMTDISVQEIDEALAYAVEAKNRAIDSKKYIYQQFIDDLLDERLGAVK